MSRFSRRFPHLAYTSRLFLSSFFLSLLAAAFLCAFCYLSQNVQGNLLPSPAQSAPAALSIDQPAAGAPPLLISLPPSWLPAAEAAAKALERYAFLIPAPLRLLHQLLYVFLS